jgi:hypothetical protein
VPVHIKELKQAIWAGMAGALAATLPELRVLTLSMNRITDIGVTPRP